MQLDGDLCLGQLGFWQIFQAGMVQLYGAISAKTRHKPHIMLRRFGYEMRAEKNNPRQVYTDFAAWLRTGNNIIWVAGIVFGYLFYLLTTDEV